MGEDGTFQTGLTGSSGYFKRKKTIINNETGHIFEKKNNNYLYLVNPVNPVKKKE